MSIAFLTISTCTTAQTPVQYLNMLMVLTNKMIVISRGYFLEGEVVFSPIILETNVHYYLCSEPLFI